MAEKIKKQWGIGKDKSKKKPAVPAPQGVTLGDLLGKKLENVKRESEEKQKKMIKEARNNPAVLRSAEKFAKTATAKPKPKAKPASK
ncbi:hypothetical protein R83H12_00139 [Fibrobacteria bacterium R8-3-H12]